MARRSRERNRRKGFRRQNRAHPLRRVTADQKAPGRTACGMEEKPIRAPSVGPRSIVRTTKFGRRGGDAFSFAPGFGDFRGRAVAALSPRLVLRRNRLAFDRLPAATGPVLLLVSFRKPAKTIIIVTARAKEVTRLQSWETVLGSKHTMASAKFGSYERCRVR